MIPEFGDPTLFLNRCSDFYFVLSTKYCIDSFLSVDTLLCFVDSELLARFNK